jgi:16S rRNA (adenine1518-N6/adenine1519-N6)-dimethyltransferase
MNSIPAKKSLGQNFLKSKIALNKMVEAGEVTGADIVLEVGPGKGVLTEKLLLTAKKVIAVEKDDRLISLLQEKFASEIANNKLEIVHDDILNIKQSDYNLKTGEYKIIANIPYYITGQFLRKFLETDCQPAKIVVMVQKEIAQRIMAHNKKENLLSISVKAFGTPKIIMKVDKENFSPAPKVDSAILSISNISKKFFMDSKIGEKEFFEILHAGFAHKRKMLISNLRALFPNIDWEGRFTSANISLKTRAEDLTLLDWNKIII